MDKSTLVKSDKSEGSEISLSVVRWICRLGVIGLVGALQLAPVSADQRAGFEPPQSALQVAPPDEFVLNGIGIRNFLFFDFYEVALFLPQKLTQANAVLRPEMPRRVRITLLRDVVAERDIEFLLDGLDDNNTHDELAAIQAPLDEFIAMIRALRTVPKGSVVEMDYLPGKGTEVWLNRRFLGMVPGAAFNRSVLKIWLGERPIQRNLKKALLSGGTISAHR